jgi:14-3-3 protein epsilon
LAEFKTGAERKEAAESTLTAYKAAQVFYFSFSDLTPWIVLFYGFWF